MKLSLFVFVALVAFVSSQDVPSSCNMEGNTYTNGLSSITFGAGVDDWIPAIMTEQDVDSLGVFFLVVQRAEEQLFSANNLYEFSDRGGPEGDDFCGPARPVGQYRISFNEVCTEITFTLEADYLCETRSQWLSQPFALQPFDGCGISGTEVTGQLHYSEDAPDLSRAASTIVFAPVNWVMLSSEDVAIWQHWAPLGADVNIVDYLSVPSGYTVEGTGQYLLQWESLSCGLQLCGIEEDSKTRAEYYHGSNFNNYHGDACREWQPAEPPVFIGECSRGGQWNIHPYECIDQEVVGGCAFCKGRVQGDEVEICVQRLGAGCNAMFNQLGVKQYCNLAFECPASTISFSVILFVSVLLAFLLA